jgi:hypothetical protein
MPMDQDITQAVLQTIKPFLASMQNAKKMVVKKVFGNSHSLIYILYSLKKLNLWQKLN